MAKIAGDAVPRTRKLTTSCQLKCSPPVPTPTEMSDKAEMVVVASNGRGGMSGMLLGSVSNAVGHSITTPLIVARAN
ncbi:hypothetical protein A5791_12455 [Mycobacterium sp. 852002-51163_SCH5372311]|nr:hypothetical protein A5791_12455 [Mycobacterium sp. 852002-51163_SCH5372311]